MFDYNVDYTPIICDSLVLDIRCLVIHSSKATKSIALFHLGVSGIVKENDGYHMPGTSLTAYNAVPCTRKEI